MNCYQQQIEMIKKPLRVPLHEVVLLDELALPIQMQDTFLDSRAAQERAAWLNKTDELETGQIWVARQLIP